MSLRFLPLAFALLASGCAPSVTPLYRDFEIEAPPLASAVGLEAGESDTAVLARLRAALAEAGWAVVPSAVAGTVSTEERGVGNWGLYRVVVSLDAIPMGEHHVRLQFHPVRYYITGGRSKVPYLGRSLRGTLLPTLNAALRSQGFYPVGTPREQDEDTVEGT